MKQEKTLATVLSTATKGLASPDELLAVQARALVRHLNAVANRQYRACEDTLALIKLRLKKHGFEKMRAMVIEQVPTSEAERKIFDPAVLFDVSNCAKYIDQLDAEAPKIGRGPRMAHCYTCHVRLPDPRLREDKPEHHINGVDEYGRPICNHCYENEVSSWSQESGDLCKVLETTGPQIKELS